MKPDILVICGPTASGKTALAAELALRLDGAKIGTEDYGALLVALSPTRLSDGGGYSALIGT